MEFILQNYQKNLDQIELNISAQEILTTALIITIILFFTSLQLLEQITIDSTLKIIVITTVSIAPILLAYFLPQAILTRRTSKLEQEIPDFLLNAATLPPGTPTQKIIHTFSKTGNSLLAREFKKAYNQIIKGYSPSKALTEITKRNESQVLNRTIQLLIQAQELGADMTKVLKSAAEDVFGTHQLIRERKAALMLQKYTLLISAVLIVPIILGLVVNIVQELDFTSIYTKGTASTDLLNAALTANQYYVAINALIVSIFISAQEKSKNSILYAIILLPLALLTYNIITNITL